MVHHIHPTRNVCDGNTTSTDWCDLDRWWTVDSLFPICHWEDYIIWKSRKDTSSICMWKRRQWDSLIVWYLSSNAHEGEKIRGADDRPFLITGLSEVAPKLDLQGSIGDVSPQRMTKISLWSNPRKQDAHFNQWWQLLATYIQWAWLEDACWTSSPSKRKPTLSLRYMHPALLEMQRSEPPILMS